MVEIAHAAPIKEIYTVVINKVLLSEGMGGQLVALLGSQKSEGDGSIR